jgi:hypothetical protein
VNLQEEPFLRSVRNVFLLQDDMVDFYWHDIIEGLKEVPGFFDFYDDKWVWEEIKRGGLLVWALSDGQIKGIVLTRVLVFPKQKVFEILAIYGIDMLVFFAEMEDTFMMVAQRLGCQTISALCRPALKRLLKGFHVEEQMVVLRRLVDVKEIM